MKYGPKGACFFRNDPTCVRPLSYVASIPGSPSTYIPLCIHMPAHFKDLQEQQAIRATQKAWWKTQVAPMEVPMRVVPQGMPNSYREKQPTLSRPASSVDLQRDLLNAMTSPLTSQTRPVPTTLPDCRVKTSETHPIKWVSVPYPCSACSLIWVIASQPSSLQRLCN